ncbi:MAG: C1 family peptidase [Burkholderiales bacterium]|nr:C1 family peptidase [Burkholderiales bacterium]
MDARPDRLDLRDRQYHPPLRSLPPQYPANEDVARYIPGYVKAKVVRDQGSEGACTGFGLACVVNYLLWRRHLEEDVPFRDVSPRMLYEMAKRYDEWQGIDYEGSSCRGALKGLHKHGVCGESFWPYKVEGEKAVFIRPGTNWEVDAAGRPLGVYYRVRRESVVDLQSAIVNIGAVYVSADVHDGWDELLDRWKPAPRKHADLPTIGRPKKPRDLGGHAFALVGYNDRGFIVQNSWGTGWGASGFAILPYDDWVEHATDAWALGLGVPVYIPQVETRTMRLVTASQWRVASGRSLTTITRAARNPHNPPEDPWPFDHPFEHEPYEPWTTHAAYVHSLVSGNDGILVVSDFTRSRADSEGYAREIVVDKPLEWAAANAGATVKLAIYAHGGLNSEEESIARTRVLAPYFDANGIYPIFLAWKTGVGETLRDIIADCARKVLGPDAERAAGFFDYLAEKRDRAVEGFAHILAKGIWTEMRENAESSRAPQGAMDLLARNLADLDDALHDAGKRLEIHVVGHSAGSILLGHLLERMSAPDLKDRSPPIETCSLFAAACSVQFAVTHYLPAADQGLIDLRRLWLHYLTDENERKDGLPTPGAPAYGKSLLYLVSRALDDARKMPLLGMERALLPEHADDDDQWAAEELPWVQQWQMRWPPAMGVPETRPDVETTRERNQIQATHGSFDNNVRAMTDVLERITGVKLAKKIEWLDY